MFLATDLLLIIVSVYITYMSYKRFVFNKYSSVAYYVILIIFVFCCIPIIMNYIIGIPKYTFVYWYRSFLPSMNNTYVAIIYDLYITVSVLVLYFYGKYRDENRRRILLNDGKNYELVPIKNKWLIYIVIFLPLIYVVFSGQISKFFIYDSLKARGITGKTNIILNSMILLSIYSCCVYFFSEKMTKRSAILLAAISIGLAWLQGKRFIIAVIAVLYLFFYTKSDIDYKTRKKIAKVIPIAFIILLVFSGIYIIKIKPLSNMGFDSMYDMLRVDYGRDDVIKYVIYKEFFLKEHILDYPGATILSTIFTFVPKFIWSSKPYPHYMYLTASILNLPIDNLPSGTTPSWFEMVLANFSYFGFLVGIITLPILCYIADSMQTIKAKSIAFMLIVVLLTQSIDAYIVFLLIFIAQYIVRIIFKGKKVVIKF